ncbi:unnamed protein product, partial [Staurois parvus]
CAVSLGHSRSPIHGRSRRCRLGHVISCVQSQLITWNMCPDDQCSCSSATCQCPSVPAVSATSLPHISAHLSCLSVPAISASQCHL